MECELCAHLFDGDKRLPKVLPCGHTACLRCLRKPHNHCCPSCSKDFNGAPAEEPEKLPTNVTLLQLMEKLKMDKSSLRAWCFQCHHLSEPSCWKSAHAVLSVRGALRRQLHDVLPLAAEQLRDLLTPEDQLPEEQALYALKLLSRKKWEMKVSEVAGLPCPQGNTLTVDNTEGPLSKALCLIVAAKSKPKKGPFY